MTERDDAIEVLTARVEHVEGVIDDIIHQLQDVQRRRALLLTTLKEQRKECNRYRRRLEAAIRENDKLADESMVNTRRIQEVTQYVETSLRTSNISDDVRVWFAHIQKLLQSE